jgi:hypothetical protein
MMCHLSGKGNIQPSSEKAQTLQLRINRCSFFSVTRSGLADRAGPNTKQRIDWAEPKKGGCQHHDADGHHSEFPSPPSREEGG